MTPPKTPLRTIQCYPDSLAGFKGPSSKGRESREGDEEDNGRAENGRGKKGGTEGEIGWEKKRGRRRDGRRAGLFLGPL